MRQLLPHPTDQVDLASAYAVPPGRHVRVNFVTSADGAATAAGLSGGLSGPADKRVFAELRDLCDVVVVGAGTVRAEGYGPARPSPERQARRVARGLPAVPPIALISGRLDLDLSSSFFVEATAAPIVLTPAASPADRRAALDGVAEVIVAGENRLDMAAALAALTDRGFPRVLCEGGPTLFGALAAAGLVDELCLTVAPLLAGPGGGRIVAGPPLPAPERLELGHVLEEDGFLFLRYAVRR